MSVEQILPAETLIQQYPPELHIYNGGNNLVLLTGNANIPLAEAVAARIGCTLDEPVSYFSNGESHVAIKENLRKRHVVIVQSGYPNPPLQKTDTEFMVDAARRGSADKIDVVYTHYPWQREDQKHRSRSSISASVVSSILQHLGAS